ncbi:MAG: BBP7 family outer membrane beta-barrel protein [Patescibacteria group bacterium]|nr:BBP7 family outer membrane beta-barrel protein [Patescibacteria group bacterium]
MLPHRTHPSLLVGLLVLLAAVPALGNDLQDLRLWAPAETGPYGNGPQPPEGFFFTLDQMFWYMTRPATQVIGAPEGTHNYTPQPVYGGMVRELVQGNSHDTSTIGAGGMSGSQRFEIGRIVDRWGWFVSAYSLHTQHQQSILNGASVVFADPQVGPPPERHYLQGYYILNPTPPPPIIDTTLYDLPVNFDKLVVTNRTKMWNVELNALLRTRQMHNGGFFEFFGGARYMEINDQFTVEACSARELNPGDRGVNENGSGWVLAPPPHRTAGDDDDDDDDDDDGTELYDAYGYRINSRGERLGFATGALSDSFWDTKADNHVIGPQLGMRWFRQHGRWRLSSEGRFFAGINNQSVTQTGYLNSEANSSVLITGMPAGVSPLGFSHRESKVEFSPAFEIRLDLHYQITRAVSLKTGWTGFWIDSIARGSALVDYNITTPDDPQKPYSAMGIDMAGNKQTVFAHGFNIGIEVNR